MVLNSRIQIVGGRDTFKSSADMSITTTMLRITSQSNEGTQPAEVPVVAITQDVFNDKIGQTKFMDQAPQWESALDGCDSQTRVREERHIREDRTLRTRGIHCQLEGGTTLAEEPTGAMHEAVDENSDLRMHWQDGTGHHWQATEKEKESQGHHFVEVLEDAADKDPNISDESYPNIPGVSVDCHSHM
ncbi:hypothetical protein IW261DRAFT_1426117 [Armillaria novae-zelandiae]|uniref:Uncharacterized protein n=1 Tax=Armillaria novae-zelandiae TaxID=153914 RepID=A0AA39NNC1_9AGAR|nr:hypothetical protein IW261DRAFT_1426117 [Armillaria novae-zelandiae]